MALNQCLKFVNLRGFSQSGVPDKRDSSGESEVTEAGRGGEWQNIVPEHLQESVSLLIW